MDAGSGTGVRRNIIRWGILGTASIATRKVIPGIQASAHGAVSAIASRDLAHAQRVANANAIPCALGSYQQLLDDRDIDAVYIPLPNHLHVEWSIRALDAGKHVLCEKPIGLDAGEARTLLTVSGRHPGLKIGEAFMYRCHPRWERVRQMVLDGAIGELRTVATAFSYDNRDAGNIRNIAAFGGGAWLDIGCYGTSVARWLFDAEPVTVQGVMQIDPGFRTDVMTTASLTFAHGRATVACATQRTPGQSVVITGTTGRIELDMPFNPPSHYATTIRVVDGVVAREIVIPPCDQFTIQADRFNAAVLAGRDVPVSIEDSLANMLVLDQVAPSTID